MNNLVISIGIGIILVVSVFFILGLDKVIIKPLIIKNYAISNMDKLHIPTKHTSENSDLA
ncbi:hypothetical protein NMT12_150160 [metagenome]